MRSTALPSLRGRQISIDLRPKVGKSKSKYQSETIDHPDDQSARHGVILNDIEPDVKWTGFNFTESDGGLGGFYSWRITL